MNKKEVVDNIIINKFALEDDFLIKRNLDFNMDLGADVIDMLDITIQLEEAFDCSILDEEYQQWKYLFNIYNFFEIQREVQGV